MPKTFVQILKEVDEFKEGAYCFYKPRGEVNTPIHQHNKGHLIYAEGGSIHIEAEGKHWFMPVHHYMWMPAFIPHRMWSYSSYIRHYTIYFETWENDDPFYKDMGIYALNDLLREMVLFTRNWEGYIGKDHLNKYRFLLSIKAILPEINKNKAPIQFSHPYPKDLRLLEIVQYINQHLDEPLPLTDLGKKFGFSERTLSRLFQQDMGMSYIQVLKTLRIMKAFELLAENKLNINEIAYSVGYNSLPTFSNTFYQLTGTRPTDYLKERMK